MGTGEEDPLQLLANPRNWRVHPKEQEQALSSVLNSVGVVQGVLVNQRSGFVVDGHLRVSMAIREEQPTVPVTYVDLSPEEETLVLSTLDSVTGMAGTDPEKLTELLDDAAQTTYAQQDEQVMELLAQIANDYGANPVQIQVSEKNKLPPKERFEEMYGTTTVRQIQLIFDEDGFEWAMDALEHICKETGAENNTDAVVLLIKRYMEQQGVSVEDAPTGMEPRGEE